MTIEEMIRRAREAMPGAKAYQDIGLAEGMRNITRCVEHLARALEDTAKGKTVLYCDMLRHNPCENCTLCTGRKCKAFGGSMMPEGAAAELARVILLALLHLDGMSGGEGGPEITAEGMLGLVLSYEAEERARERARSEDSIN